MDGIGKIGLTQYRDAISLWRVCVPDDVDRTQYLRTCFLTGTVSLVNENGEIQHRVKIGQLAIQTVTFPADATKLGSQVVCVTAPYSGQLFVVDVYTTSDQFNAQSESQYRLFKVGSGFAELRVDGQGRILLSVDGDDDVAEVNISIASPGGKGKFKVGVNGDVLVHSEGNTQLTTSNSLKASYVKAGDKETSIEITKDQVMIATEGKIYLNQSDEPILLGNKTVQLLSDLLDQLSKESAGPYPLLGNSVYGQIKEGLEELKSKLSFVK